MLSVHGLYAQTYDVQRHKQDSVRLVDITSYWSDAKYDELSDIASYSWRQKDYRNYFEAGFQFLHTAVFLKKIKRAQWFLVEMQHRRDSLKHINDPVYLQTAYSRDSRINLFFGRFYFSAYLYEEAKPYYRLAIQEEKNGVLDSTDEVIAGQAYNALGELCLETGNLDSAYTCISKGLYYRKKYNYPNDLAYSFRNMGFVHEKRGTLDSAVFYYRLMREYWLRAPETQSSKDWVDLQYFAYTARALYSQHHITEAEQILEEFGRMYTPEITFHYKITERNVFLLDLYLAYLVKYGKRTQAQQVVHSIEQATRNTDIYQTRRLYLYAVLLRWYHTYDQPMFSSTLERYIAYSDSISTTSNRFTIKNDLADIEMEVRDRKLYQQSVENTYYRNTVIIGGGVLVLVIIGGIVLYRLYKRVRFLNLQLGLANTSLDSSNAKLGWSNQELQQTNARLEDTLQEKDELMNIVAHDLKNPLTSILLRIGLIQTVLERNADPQFDRMLIPHLMETLSLMADQVQRMTMITEGMLRYERIQRGALSEKHLEPLDISTIFRQTMDAFNEKAQNKSIILNVSNTLHNDMIIGDEYMLRSIMENLISNALKFSPPDTITTVSLEPAPTHDMIRFTVSDQGPGISHEDQQNLYQRFVKLSARPTGGESSSGLGLSIVKKMVEALRGSIECISDGTTGTAFTVDFPIYYPEESSADHHTPTTFAHDTTPTN